MDLLSFSRAVTRNPASCFTFLVLTACGHSRTIFLPRADGRANLGVVQHMNQHKGAARKITRAKHHPPHRGTASVYVEPGFTVHPDYGPRPILCPDSPRGRTGLLKVMELRPVRGGLPRFVGRWDSAANQLDVDIYGVTRAAKKRFTNETDGYRGHHNSPQPGAGRRVPLTIMTPQLGVVFAGVIGFGLALPYDAVLAGQGAPAGRMKK